MSFQTSGDAPDRPVSEAPGAPPPTPDAEPGTSAQPTSTRGEIPRTRTARAHNALIAGAIVLILLLVFIIENTESVKIRYFGAGFHLPLGVALLLAAIGGALLIGIVGAARIMQLRRTVRRQR
jgi:uncharacterized integral membrane protein